MKRFLTVFIIDDDQDDREMFVEVVAEINNSIICITASNGQEALQLLQDQGENPDLIFLDLNMPRMNGKQFLSKLKNMHTYSSIPVIIYSTSKNEADREETKQLGADLFITKPSSLQELKKELEIVFAQKNADISFK